MNKDEHAPIDHRAILEKNINKTKEDNQDKYFDYVISNFINLNKANSILSDFARKGTPEIDSDLHKKKYAKLQYDAKSIESFAHTSKHDLTKSMSKDEFESLVERQPGRDNVPGYIKKPETEFNRVKNDVTESIRNTYKQRDNIRLHAALDSDMNPRKPASTDYENTKSNRALLAVAKEQNRIDSDIDHIVNVKSGKLKYYHDEHKEMVAGDVEVVAHKLPMDSIQHNKKLRKIAQSYTNDEFKNIVDSVKSKDLEYPAPHLGEDSFNEHFLKNREASFEKVVAAVNKIQTQEHEKIISEKPERTAIENQRSQGIDI